MKAEKIVEIARRANYSRIAKKMEDFEFSYPVYTVTVAQNAPARIQKDGTYPDGWVELDNPFELTNIGNPYIPCEIWIKTATLGGRRRAWVRSAY